MSTNLNSRSIFRNILYGFSTWILPLFLGLFVTRIVVKTLGHADYGIYALALGFVAYSFNFSISKAITKYVAEYRSSGGGDRINAVYSATVILTVIVALSGFVAMWALSGWLVNEVFDIEPDSRGKAITGLRIAAATIATMMFTQIGTSVVQGLHRFDVFSRIQNANSLLIMVGNLFLAYSGYGLRALLWWNLAACISACVFALLSSRRLFPDLSFTFSFGSAALRVVLKYSAGIVGYQIVSNAYFLFERGWIISKLGPEALTFYVIPMTLGIHLIGLVASLTMVVFPLASELVKDPDRLLKLYRTATKAVLFIVVIISVSLIIEGKVFLTLWLGPEFGDRSAMLLIIHAIAFGVGTITIVSYQMAEGIGWTGFNFRNTAIGMLLGLCAMLLFTNTLGSLGVAYGRIAAFSVPFVAIFDLEHRFIGSIQYGFWYRNLIRFGIAALLAVGVEYLLIENLPLSWATLVLSTFSGLTAYSGFLWLSGVATSDERRQVRLAIQRSAS